MQCSWKWWLKGGGGKSKRQEVPTICYMLAVTCFARLFRAFTGGMLRTSNLPPSPTSHIALKLSSGPLLSQHAERARISRGAILLPHSVAARNPGWNLQPSDPGAKGSVIALPLLRAFSLYWISKMYIPIICRPMLLRSATRKVSSASYSQVRRAIKKSPGWYMANSPSISIRVLFFLDSSPRKRNGPKVKHIHYLSHPSHELTWTRSDSSSSLHQIFISPPNQEIDIEFDSIQHHGQLAFCQQSPVLSRRRYGSVHEPVSDSSETHGLQSCSKPLISM